MVRAAWMHVVQGACTCVDNENEVSFYSHHSKGDQASSTSAQYNSGRDSILIVSTPKHVSVCVCIYARTCLRAPRYFEFVYERRRRYVCVCMCRYICVRCVKYLYSR